MMISSLKSTSEYRGGQHGEASASHDNPKKNGSEEIGPEEENSEANEGQEELERPIQSRRAQVCEDRQSQSSNESSPERTEPNGGDGMTSPDSNLPKTGAQAAKVLGNLFNDARVTNVLMLGLLLIGMGGAEMVQSQMCSL